MICRILIIASTALALASAAQAQTRKPTAQETKLVRTCVEQKGGTDKDAQCIGLVSKRCAAKPENQGGLSRADCYRIEQDIWNVVLTEQQKDLTEELDEDQKAKLTEMQKAWVAARDATCEFYYHKIQGSMSVPMTASCMLTETAKRALFLKAMQGL